MSCSVYLSRFRKESRSVSNRTYMTGTRYYRISYPNWQTGAGNQYDADWNDGSFVWNTFHRTSL